MIKKLLLLFSLFLWLQKANAQCPGSWTGNTSGLNYLCANGPFLQFDLNITCPPKAQATYHFTQPQPLVVFNFSAFGSQGSPGESRMAIFLNGKEADLHKACQIGLGCQPQTGTYSISSNGCLVDSISGSDGGISGYIVLSAAEYGLSSIDSIGVAVSEPSSSGTIFQIDSCISTCVATGIPSLAATIPLSIYPNPVSNLLHIYAEGAQLQTIYIYDLNGKLIYSMPLKTTVDVSALSSGVYFVEVVSAGDVVRRKFMKI